MSSKRFQTLFGAYLILILNAALADVHTGLDTSRSNPDLVVKQILNTDYTQTPKPLDTWVDVQHNKFETQIDTWSHSIDDWFGEPDTDTPASAKIRAILDQSYSSSEGYRIKPRIRASIKLPTLKKRWSVVFGDDHLDDEFQRAAHLNNTPMPPKANEKSASNEKDPSESQSLALRLSKETKRLGIDTDLDVGIRSGDDVYVRAKASKNWDIAQEHELRFEQMVRYGSESQTHARTNLEWRHQVFENHFWSNQMYVGYDDDAQDLGLRWGNTLFAEHSFFKNQRLNYGISASGSEKKQHLNSYGPFVSWRQPVWREWMYVQGDVNYNNNKDSERSHEVSTFVRMEAIF